MLRVTPILWTATDLSLALLGSCDETGSTKDGPAADARAKSAPGKPKELVNVRLTVPGRDDELRTTLTNAWGVPRERKELSETVYTWFNPHNRLRATLKDGSARTGRTSNTRPTFRSNP